MSCRDSVKRRFSSLISVSSHPLPKTPLQAFFETVVLSSVTSQRAPNPPEFAQPRLSRVKRRSSPARGYKFGCVCSCMAGHEDARVVTGHIET